MYERGALSDWVTGQWSSRSNDTTDTPSETQCILGQSNPHQQWLWGGPVHLQSWCEREGERVCVIVCVCVYPEPALMIVGKLTWAIVILMELHGKAYRFTAGEERKPQTLGGQKLREKEVNYPTQLFFPL